MGEVVDLRELRNKVAVFSDRADAGRRLGEFLSELGVKASDVLAIPNGGIAVGLGVAKALGARLWAAVVKKVLFPWTTEAGFGAVSWLGDSYIDEDMARSASLTSREVEEAVERARREVKARAEAFRAYLPAKLSGQVVLVDDGLATGYTMLVTVRSVMRLGADRVVVAVPTSPVEAAHLLSEEVELVVVLNLRRGPLFAVADAYRLWYDVPLSEALRLLELANR